MTSDVSLVRRSRLPLTDLRSDDVPLPSMATVIDGWADHLDAGRGFVLVSGLPVETLGEEFASIAYMGSVCPHEDERSEVTVGVTPWDGPAPSSTATRRRS